LVPIMTLRLSVFTILFMAAAVTVLGETKDPIQEQVVSIISNIDNYVSWPAAKADSSKPFFVAVLGESALATRVKELNRTKLPDGRKIRVRIVRGNLLPANAHIVINSLSDEKLVAKLLKKLVGTGTLTVSTGDTDVASMLHLVMADVDGKQKVRMTLNTEMAADEHLEIKSEFKKLLAEKS
jgi:hypothetical protein